MNQTDQTTQTDQMNQTNHRGRRDYHSPVYAVKKVRGEGESREGMDNSHTADSYS